MNEEPCSTPFMNQVYNLHTSTLVKEAFDMHFRDITAIQCISGYHILLTGSRDGAGKCFCFSFPLHVQCCASLLALVLVLCSGHDALLETDGGVE